MYCYVIYGEDRELLGVFQLCHLLINNEAELNEMERHQVIYI